MVSRVVTSRGQKVAAGSVLVDWLVLDLPELVLQLMPWTLVSAHGARSEGIPAMTELAQSNCWEPKSLHHNG